jgi:prepilin peptidase CpaA
MADAGSRRRWDVSPASLWGVKVGLLVVIGVAAVVWDIRTRRLPNVLTFGAAAVGVAFAAFESGGGGATWSLVGWLTGIGLFLPMFVLGGLGGGDVKLLGAYGAWLGPVGAIWTGFAAALFGGVFALGVALMTGYIGEAFRNLSGAIRFWITVGPGAVPGMTLDDTKGPRLAYAVPIVMGGLVAAWMTGR